MEIIKYIHFDGGIMTEKRFERIYEDVDVEGLKKRFSVKKSGSGLYYRDGDYEIDNTIQFIIETVEMKLNQLSDENEELKKENEFLKKRCNEYWKESGLNNDYFE